MQSTLTKWLAVAAMTVGIAGGSYGIASAASGGSTTTTPSAAPAPPSMPPSGARGWGAQRSDETPQTGDSLAKLTAAAEAKVPGAAVVRAETDADGHGTYEVHMAKSDGTLVTVYFDADYKVTSVETR